MLKQRYRLFTFRLCAEELLADALAAAGFTKISSPEEEAHVRGYEAHTALSIVIAHVFPPLPLSGAEGSHVKDQAGHGFKPEERLAPRWTNNTAQRGQEAPC